MERVPKRCWNLATSSRLWTGNQAFKALCAARLRASVTPTTVTGLSFGRSRPQQVVISNSNLTRVTPSHFLQAHDSNVCLFQFINQQAGCSRYARSKCRPLSCSHVELWKGLSLDDDWRSPWPPPPNAGRQPPLVAAAPLTSFVLFSLTDFIMCGHFQGKKSLSCELG